MINYLDILFFLGTSVIGTVVFSSAIFLIMSIGAKEKTYYKIENGDIYVVYKWVTGRAKGYHKYKFKKDKEKWILLKRKITFLELLPLIIIGGIFFMISVIKAGLLAGIGILLYSVLVYIGFLFALDQYNVLYCRSFLTKKIK